LSTSRPDILLDAKALASWSPQPGLGGAVEALLRQQHETWPLLRAGYDGLKNVKLRSLRVGDAEIRVQCNPGRIVSSSANVDPKAIAQRPCFLCGENLPPEQQGLVFEDDYIVLCNPFPIFPAHFTIPHREHRPQLIEGAFTTLLRLSKGMGPGYWVFYNGPKCGASAPDHLHFQAGTAAALPVTAELDNVLRRNGVVLLAGRFALLSAVATGYLRSAFVLRGVDEGILDRLFRLVMGSLPGAGDEEPMINCLVRYEGGTWSILLFPRARHRPSMYFVEGEGRLLLSPAAVDLAGLLITPLPHDYDRVDSRIIEQMFSEICLAPSQFASVTEKIKDTADTALHAG
jgi:hypothetical protein